MAQTIDIRQIIKPNNYRNPISDELKAAGWTTFDAPLTTEEVEAIKAAALTNNGGDADKAAIEGAAKIGEAHDARKAKALFILGGSTEKAARDAFVKIVSKDPELVSLAATIETEGQLQPIKLQKIPGVTGFEIVFGERRALARLYNWAKAGGKDEPTVQAEVVEGMEPKSIRLQDFVSNIRKAANPVEEGLALKAMIADGKKVKDLAALLGMSQERVRQLVKVAKLPPETQAKVAAGELAYTKAIGVGESRYDEGDDGEPSPKPKKLRSRQDIIDARKEYEAGSEGYRVLSWVLGLRKKIDA